MALVKAPGPTQNLYISNADVVLGTTVIIVT